MAKLIQSGEFIGRGERATAARLEAELPDAWVIISNKQLVNPDGSSREVDFIVVGEHVVYTIDEKSYRGTIRGSDIAWVLPSGESERSPISNCEMIARRLVGHLANSVPRLRQAMAGRHFVFARVVLSSLEADCRVNDPRVPTQVLRLATCADELVLFDRRQTEKASINPYRKGIIDELTVLRDRPRIPKAVGDYEVIELIETRGPRRILRARHRDGTEKLLQLIEQADTAIGERAASAELFALREYEALRRLAELGRAPQVDPYFTWNEGRYWVIPVHLLPGKTLRACREGALALDPMRTASDAFAALSDLHNQGIVHRGLSPETVFVRDDGSVAFTDFSRSRLPGEVSLAPALEPPASGDPYASEEIRLGYGFAEASSDVFSLAASIINWASGYEPTAEGPWQPDDDTLQALSGLFGPELADLLRLCLADDRLRPSASALAEAFRLRLEVVSAPAVDKEAGPGSKPTDAVGVGATIAGRYLVERELGAGGSAHTYLASDALTDQQVVLKVFDDPELAARLAPNEFKILGSLSHPCFPRVFEVNRPSDPYQLKLEYVEGRDLRAILDAGGADLGLGIRLWRELGGALQYLERRGLCHRDISPANILVPSDPDRPAQLIDFGVATVATGGKTAVGTSWYRDPEVEEGVGWSTSADRYSLAVCVFQAMFGRLPFAVDEETRRADKTTILSPGDDERRGVSDHQVAALLRAIESDASHRYSSATEWLDALEPPAVLPAPVEVGAPSADEQEGRAPVSTPAPAAQDGQRMLNGRYLLVPDSVIAGGIADVYRAVDVRNPDRPVAVKIIRQSEDQDWMVRLSFDREIGSLRALKHEHIVALVDAGQDVITGEYFIVLDWLPRTLEDQLEELPELREWPAFAEAVALPLARAIAFAHEHRVVHRDIKPSNILVGADGTLKLADFGISAIKSRLPVSQHTLADFMSRPFAPPERETLTDYDRDVFAFGVLVVDCLSTSGVEDYPDIEPALAELAVPEGIFDLVRRCVSFDPLARPQYGLVLVAELEQLAQARATIGARASIPCVVSSRYLEDNLRQAALKRGVATATRFLADELSEGVFGKRAPGDNNSADQYAWLIGRSWRFRAKVQRTPGQLQIVGGGHMEAEALDFEREHAALLPFRFEVNNPEFDPRAATDAVSDFMDRIALEEEHQAEVESAKDERKLFAQWSNQLRARQAFEGSKEDPLDFNSATLEGARLRLELAVDLAQDLVGQQRIVRSDGHLDRRLAGTVARVHGRRIEIWLERDPGVPAPKRGSIVFDTGPSAAALKRQRDALYALRYQTPGLRRLDLP